MENFMSKIALDSDFALRTLRNETISTKWDFSGSFSFVITVVSTIGKFYSATQFLSVFSLKN